MAGESTAQPPVHAFVDRNAHGSDRFQHLELAGLDDRDDLLLFHRGKAIEEVFDGFTALKLINEVLERNACADENRRSPHDFGIGMNHALEVFYFHRIRITAPGWASP